MNRYRAEIIDHRWNNPQHKLNSDASLFRLREEIRRVSSLEKLHSINKPRHILKFNDPLPRKIFHHEVLNQPSTLRRDYRSQSPRRERNHQKQITPNTNSIKPSQYQKTSHPAKGSSQNKTSRVSTEVSHASTKLLEQLKSFEEKYFMKFINGYSDKVLAKCVELMHTEDNAIILENIIPGKYKDLLPTAIKPKLGFVNHVQINSYNNLKNLLPQSTKGIVLPPLFETPKSTLTEKKSFDFAGRSYSDRKDQSFSSQFKDEGFTSGVPSLNQFPNLPKLNVQEFKESLSLMTNGTQKSCLILISANNKSFPLEFGFCEIVLDEEKGHGQMSRYFIGKIYRKLKMVEVLTIKLMDYFFQRYRIDRISIDFLIQNESILKEMKAVGFKLQKVDQVSTRYKTYMIHKKEFYALFNELMSKMPNNNVHTQQ